MDLKIHLSSLRQNLENRISSKMTSKKRQGISHMVRENRNQLKSKGHLVKCNDRVFCGIYLELIAETMK